MGTRTLAVLRLGEKASFEVSCRASAPAGLSPSAALTITKDGKLVRSYTMHATASSDALTFTRDVHFTDKALAGTLFAHFQVRSGSAGAKRDRKFVLMP